MIRQLQVPDPSYKKIIHWFHTTQTANTTQTEFTRQQLIALDTELASTTLHNCRSAIKEQLQLLFKQEKVLRLQPSDEVIQH